MYHTIMGIDVSKDDFVVARVVCGRVQETTLRDFELFSYRKKDSFSLFQSAQRSATDKSITTSGVIPS